MELTQLIKDNYCYFDSYRQGVLYYMLHVYIPPMFVGEGQDRHTLPSKTTHYQFTIPIDDVGNATLNKKEKAITLMRWVRKAHEGNELIKIREIPN